MKQFAEGNGIKFLTPWGTTEQYRTEYALPLPGEKWGAWMEHPEPVEPDGKDYGSGRYHVMKSMSAAFAPANWWPWWVQYDRVVGESDQKAGVVRLRLRRIRPEVMHRMIRFGWCSGAYLEGAYLKGANLKGANLYGAYLKGANLKGANLEVAYLEGAYLEGAYLEGANLEGANLKGAYLYGANLEGTNLKGANLEGAYLKGANLYGAYLKGANLKGAYHGVIGYKAE